MSCMGWESGNWISGVNTGVIPFLQDAFWISMAMTIMAGLAVGTILTMALVKALYTIIYRIPSAPTEVGAAAIDTEASQ